MGIYESLGVKPIINATGVFTRLGGSLMPPEVMAAMVEASKQFVCLEELQYRAGKIIAEITGAEAAYIVSGAYAGIVLSIAACMTGLDPVKMNRLPNTSGMKNQVIMEKMHICGYEHAAQAAGAHLVEVGLATYCQPGEIETAINEQTAAILFLADWAGDRVSLGEVVSIGHRYGVPVVVDASGRLDDPRCLTSYIAAGPDLVVFSGGKYIRGPQASGLICGRRDLISAIAFQHLDLDVTPEVWMAPRELLPFEELPFIPHHGIGRGYKAGKEEIVGLVTALRLFTKRDHKAEQVVWNNKMHYIVDNLAEVPHLRPEFLAAGVFRREIPHARISIDEPALGMTAYEFTRALQQGDPPIHPIDRELPKGAIVINPFGLVDGDEIQIVESIKRIVREKK